MTFEEFGHLANLGFAFTSACFFISYLAERGDIAFTKKRRELIKCIKKYYLLATDVDNEGEILEKTIKNHFSLLLKEHENYRRLLTKALSFSTLGWLVSVGCIVISILMPSRQIATVLAALYVITTIGLPVSLLGLAYFKLKRTESMAFKDLVAKAKQVHGRLRSNFSKSDRKKFRSSRKSFLRMFIEYDTSAYL